MGELAKSFGIRLRTLRGLKTLTQAQLADSSGMSEEWVRRIERGEASPSFDTIESLAGALGVSAGELFERPAKSLAIEELIATAERLSPEEVDWALGLFRHLRKKPTEL